MNKIIIFTGAGLSAESGISTFRDIDGLWESHNIEEICNIRSWEKNKEKVFKFYNQRRQQLSRVEPSSGHFLIKKIQDTFGEENVINITQNVDDLLERAGVKNIIHVHGKLQEMMCVGLNHTWDVGYNEVEGDNICCPICGNRKIKPNVVFFGESAPNYIDMYGILQTMDKNDILLVIGTMGNVVPIEIIVKGKKSYKILNNLEKSPYINDKVFDKVFYSKISESADEIFKEIEKVRNESK